jgi:hypothetical protein
MTSTASKLKADTAALLQESENSATMGSIVLSKYELDSIPSSMTTGEIIFINFRLQFQAAYPVAVATKPTSILGLATEVIMMIFESILADCEDWCTALSFALSSRRLYRILQSLYRKPIRLSVAVGMLRNFHDIVRDFIGPNYTLRYIQLDHGYSEPIFLNNDVYGVGAKRAGPLQMRWKFYREVFYTDEGGNEVPILPRPMGMGKSWYKEAMEATQGTDWWKMMRGLNYSDHGYTRRAVWQILTLRGEVNQLLRDTRKHDLWPLGA